MADQFINLFQSGPFRNPEEMAFRSAGSLQHDHRTEKFSSLTSPTCKQPVVPVLGIADLSCLCQWLSKSIIVWTAGHLLGFKAGSKGREQDGGSNLLLLLPLLLEIAVKASPPGLALGTRARSGPSLSRLRRQPLASWLRRHLSFSPPASPFTLPLLWWAMSCGQPSAALPALPGQLPAPGRAEPRQHRSPAGAALRPLGSAGGCPGPRHPPATHTHTHTLLPPLPPAAEKLPPSPALRCVVHSFPNTAAR